ncbi:phytanoyl-CoA dioxygenase family protein [Moorena sp. SIO3H5]|uniref:phytanoyl-CoA dioxygenase family protein n=1 Tax=Moorena sp. SIO3H5 TaxID=2607834 RepID=UPI0013B7DFF3|nr:phytanoyl-CoA dioxygenase family protein [Moorena sp. SIO3H5]NEO68848.1 phytanoyl-CoA dioxygenase family protein [Moorena sp. SIO3H5]
MLSNSQLNQSESDQKYEFSYQLTEAQIAQYHRDGFLIVPGFFQSAETEVLHRSLITHVDEYAPLEIQTFDRTGQSYSILYWAELGDSLLGVFPRIARIVDGAEALLGEACYHWHSKICRKLPNSGQVEWHQDYGSWYYNHCLSPQLITCAIAIEPCSLENGCLQMLKGSHVLGRMEVIEMGNTVGTDPQRVQKAMETMEIVNCDMEPGDAVFFHSNVLHGSPPNRSDRSRTMIFCGYNAVLNEPFIREGQEHHCYRPLHKLPDSVIMKGAYGAALENKAEVYKPRPEIDKPYMNIHPFPEK